MDKQTLEDNLQRVQRHLQAMSVENAALREAARLAVKTGDAWMRCLDEFANEPGGLQTCSEWADDHDAALATLAKLIDYERL